MKILLLDDEEIYFDLFNIIFNNYEIYYEKNPVTWRNKIDLEKTNLNIYDFIFCDYYFDNLSKNSFQLYLSKYIREKGFKNYLVLFSNLTEFSEKEIKNEYFDLLLDKMEFSMAEYNDDIINFLEEKCKKSSFRKA